MQQYECQLGLV